MKKLMRRNKSEITRFYPEPQKGLSDSEVQLMTQQGYTNANISSAEKTVGQIIFTNVFTYFNLVFAVFAFFLILVKSYNNLTFLPVVILNSLIGIIQEVRAKRVLDKLTFLHAPHAIAVRNCREIRLNSNDLVLDDIIILSAGDQICADALILSGEVQVNESLLTGEADEIRKKKGDKLFSGSFVVSGKCYARLYAVGEDSYISKLTQEAKRNKKRERSKMTYALDKIVKTVGVIIIPLAAALVATRLIVLHDNFEHTIVSTSAALIGMIPQGLYLLSSIALAVSVMRLAKSRVLVHEMSCIETLARVDVLCVDKTGTITSGDMAVNDIVALPQYSKDEHGSLEQLICDLAGNTESDNITSCALKKYFESRLKCTRKAESVTEFSSKTKYSSVKIEGVTYILGAPEFVMRDEFSQIQKITDGYFSKGNRVLVFGIYHGDTDGKELIRPVTPLGLVLLSNPIRENAVDTFKYFTAQGVEIKVISGDNPTAVSSVALKAGIKNADSFISADKLDTDEKIFEAADKYTVFGRTTPEQKRKLICSLKKKGHTVAMVGDGVNDVLALKDSDCSVAMASGSSAAGHVSQLVLLDSDFSHMPCVVNEGRRVVNNIQRSASLFLVKTIFSLLTAVLAVCALLTYPLIPAQMSLIGAFTIGIPAFFLAMEPNKKRIEGDFLKTVLTNAIPAGITQFILTGAMMLIGDRLGLSHLETSTAATFIIAFVGVLMIIMTARPLNFFRSAVAIGSILGMVAAGYLFRGLLNFTMPSLVCIVCTGILSLVSIPLIMILYKAIVKIKRK